jgi:hypothetical protein
LDSRRILTGEIVHLDSVNAEVVQFPGLIIKSHQFPSPRANCSVALVLEKQHACFATGAELLHQVRAWQREFAVVPGTADRNGSWKQIDDMSGLVID